MWEGSGVAKRTGADEELEVGDSGVIEVEVVENEAPLCPVFKGLDDPDCDRRCGRWTSKVRERVGGHSELRAIGPRGSDC